MWGGLECTFNRVGEKYFDQFELSGHYNRPEDLEAIAALGVRTLRYPVLWERAAAGSAPNQEFDWSFADERLAILRDLGITPIVGLVHHGSGPRYTDLLDPLFPEKLARFARAVAERYPWLEFYTPVNEPLTTARFSALYGVWYPHCRDTLAFLRAVVHQCRAVMLAMREIRRVNPQAKLVQTEDMGRTQSTSALAYQAEFENERRWLSYDFLCGRVTSEHPLAGFLRWAGLPEEEFLPLAESPCPPDIIGINYYLTSERFLDERLARYPESTHGGNGRHAYADVAAVRVCADGIGGAGAVLREAWQRYALPLAITEAHLGCTREEQARWLWEVWNEAQAAQCEGIDVRAVTAWSLLGAYNWNTLVTCEGGYYEPGAFDLRGGELHQSVVSHLISDLASGRKPEIPILSSPGWWRQPTRFDHPPITSHQAPIEEGGKTAPGSARQLVIGVREKSHDRPAPLLIIGANGTLGRAFARACHMRHLPHHLLTRQQMDIADTESVKRALKEWKPWAVINAAGYVRVDDAEQEPENCFRENCHGPAILARECAAKGISLLTFSSDLVFDGNSNTPYRESDAVNALNIYGRSKIAAEKQVLRAHPSALVVRTSAFFGPWDEHNFVTVCLREIEQNRSFCAVDDTMISPTYVPDLTHAALDLLTDGESGIWHLANRGATTWFDLACRAAFLADADETLITPRCSTEMDWSAPRPRYSVLETERSLPLPTLDDALERYFHEREEK